MSDAVAQQTTEQEPEIDLSIADVREKLADISEMRDVIARDLWDSTDSAHAQIIDLDNGNNYAKQFEEFTKKLKDIDAIVTPPQP